MKKIRHYLPLLALPLLAACTSLPVGPSMLVLPGTGKNFETFRADDYSCRQFASYQVGGQTPNQAYASSGFKSAAVGTALGAGAGAAIGGGSGAAVGAGAGLLAGGLTGIDPATLSEYEAQRFYDNAYVQCMYAKGHRVPVSGQFTNSTPAAAPAIKPDSSIPPPPPGLPPPPPPGLVPPPKP